jgi:hypothetical protein
VSTAKENVSGNISIVIAVAEIEPPKSLMLYNLTIKPKTP